MAQFPFSFYIPISIVCIVYRELHVSGQFETMTREVDEEEHSIEMHLPYVAKVMERWEERGERGGGGRREERRSSGEVGGAPSLATKPKWRAMRSWV